MKIKPSSALRNDYAAISKLAKVSGEPIFITNKGEDDGVFMSMETYESTMRQIAMYRDIEISEKQIEEGQVKDARTALREMRAKYGI